MCTFIGILKAPPPAYVVYQDFAEISMAGLDILEQLLQSVTTLNVESAPILIGRGTHNDPLSALGVLADYVALVLSGVLLMLGGHPHVLCSADRIGRTCWRG